jgi:hypothetical protein
MRKILPACFLMFLSAASHAQDAGRGALNEDKAAPNQPGITEKLPVFTYRHEQVVLEPKGEWRRYNNLRADQINCLNTALGPLKVKFLAVHANDVTYYAGSGFGIEITNPAGRPVPAKDGDPAGSKWQKQGANRWAILIFNRGEEKDGNYTQLSPAALNQENADVVRNLDPTRQVCVVVNDYDPSTNGGGFDLDVIELVEKSNP